MQEIFGFGQEEISMNEPLLEYGDVSRTEIPGLRRQEAELEAEITNKRNSYFKDVQAEFNETEEELESVRQALVQKKRQLSQKTLNAPLRGIVKNIRVVIEGGVIRPGEEVMEIVPIEEDFIEKAVACRYWFCSFRPRCDRQSRCLLYHLWQFRRQGGLYQRRYFR